MNGGLNRIRFFSDQNHYLLVRELSTITYHSGKLYLPKSIREELGLADGDQMEVTSRNGKIIACPMKTRNPEELLIRYLRESPKRMKPTGTPISPPWRRRDLYGIQER